MFLIQDQTRTETDSNQKIHIQPSSSHVDCLRLLVFHNPAKGDLTRLKIRTDRPVTTTTTTKDFNARMSPCKNLI